MTVYNTTLFTDNDGSLHRFNGLTKKQFEETYFYPFVANAVGQTNFIKRFKAVGGFHTLEAPGNVVAVPRDLTYDVGSDAIYWGDGDGIWRFTAPGQ